MAIFYGITHDDKLVREKVGFFADAFHFAAETVGINDFISVDNPLSLVEKVIIQLESGSKNLTKYIDSYLTSPWLDENNIFLKEFQGFINFCRVVTDYRNEPPNKRKEWIQNTPRFLDSLRVLKKELESEMFQKALKSIISYLNCTHDIDTHKAEYLSNTNCLVTEFVLND